MRLLLLGCTGQVGWELQRALQPLGAVTALDVNTTPGVDFTQVDALAALARRVKPDVIVNAAAHTAVDKAESEPELARLINALAPGRLAAEAATLGALLVHYSTDYVFDGSGDQPRSEDAPTGPLNVYGCTKLEGEDLIRASGCRHLILRTSWVYAARGGNFARTMLKLACERERLTVIDDQIGAPTGADLLADVTAHAIRAVSAQPTLCGTYHAVADGQTSWHDYACHVIERARAQGLPVRVAPAAVEAVPTTAFPTPARRPLNSRLDTTRLRRIFGLHLPDWTVGVDRLLDELLPVMQATSKATP
jgi:dTDP-4-dehydrorhamnose reductase